MNEAEAGTRKDDPEGLDEATINGLVAEVEARGYAVAERVIPDAFRLELIDRIDACMERLGVGYGENEFLGARTRRLFNLLSRDRLFERTPIFRGSLPVVERLLDSECLLSSLTAIEMNPGETRQPLHADDGSYGFVRPAPTSIVVAMWALTDFTGENGGTHVVPGSHRRGNRPGRGDEPDQIQVEMPAGSILFYSGSLWHGGGENRSASRRMGIVNNYCAGWLRQEESQLLALSRDRVAAFEPRLRRLVGYGTYRGLLGHVDQQNPERMVDPEAETDMIWKKIKR